MIEANIVQKPRVELCDSHSLLIGNDSSGQKILQESLSSSISKLENEIQDKLKQLLSSQQKQLSEIGDNINSLTQELEEEMLKFHKIARVTNNTHRSLQSFLQQTNGKTKQDCNDRSTESTEFEELNKIATNYSKLPIVDKHNSGYILKDRKVDLSKLE